LPKPDAGATIRAKESPMIKHVVFFSLKPEAEGKGKAENARIIKSRLEALNGKIPVIVKLEVGINSNPAESGWDLALVSEFKNTADLDAYQKHPEHVKVGEFIGKVKSGRACVDYDF
jgi:Stress responsive A/B Barrel Domain